MSNVNLRMQEISRRTSFFKKFANYDNNANLRLTRPTTSMLQNHNNNNTNNMS